VRNGALPDWWNRLRAVTVTCGGRPGDRVADAVHVRPPRRRENRCGLPADAGSWSTQRSLGAMSERALTNTPLLLLPHDQRHRRRESKLMRSSPQIVRRQARGPLEGTPDLPTVCTIHPALGPRWRNSWQSSGQEAPAYWPRSTDRAHVPRFPGHAQPRPVAEVPGIAGDSGRSAASRRAFTLRSLEVHDPGNYWSVRCGGWPRVRFTPAG
jgi:hypothetical protein